MVYIQEILHSILHSVNYIAYKLHTCRTVGTDGGTDGRTVLPSRASYAG